MYIFFFFEIINPRTCKDVPERWAVTVYTITAQPSGTTLIVKGLLYTIVSKQHLIVCFSYAKLIMYDPYIRET